MAGFLQLQVSRKTHPKLHWKCLSCLKHNQIVTEKEDIFCEIFWGVCNSGSMFYWAALHQESEITRKSCCSSFSFAQKEQRCSSIIAASLTGRDPGLSYPPNSNMFVSSPFGIQSNFNNFFSISSGKIIARLLFQILHEKKNSFDFCRSSCIYFKQRQWRQSSLHGADVALYSHAALTLAQERPAERGDTIWPFPASRLLRTLVHLRGLNFAFARWKQLFFSLEPQTCKISRRMIRDITWSNGMHENVKCLACLRPFSNVTECTASERRSTFGIWLPGGLHHTFSHFSGWVLCKFLLCCFWALRCWHGMVGHSLTNSVLFFSDRKNLQEGTGRCGMVWEVVVSCVDSGWTLLCAP